MKGSLSLIVLVITLAALNQAQTEAQSRLRTSFPSESSGSISSNDDEMDVKPARLGTTSSFDVHKLDERITNEFRRAWRSTSNGAKDVEAVVLILHGPEGTYEAQFLKGSNEFKSFTFSWNPSTLAIVHTHPNECGAKPTQNDMKISDQLNVPICTISSRGMYVYDPSTKKVLKLRDGLDWLKPMSKGE